MTGTEWLQKPNADQYWSTGTGKAAHTHLLGWTVDGNGSCIECTWHVWCVRLVVPHVMTHWCCTRPSGDQSAMGTSMPPLIISWLKGSYATEKMLWYPWSPGEAGGGAQGLCRGGVNRALRQGRVRMNLSMQEDSSRLHGHYRAASTCC